jgi:osmotically-inducible protein OsmY
LKKSIATVLYVTCAAFGISAYAADSGYTPPVETRTVHSKYFSPQRKAQRAEDRALAKKVRVAMQKSGSVNLANVTVLARSGKVTLTGYVPDNGQIELAKSSASSVEGVTSVTNNLVEGQPGS